LIKKLIFRLFIYFFITFDENNRVLKILIIGLLTFFFVAQGSAQDTLTLISGKMYPNISIVQEDGHFLRFKKSGSNRVKSLDIPAIFSIHNGSKETVYYRQDTMSGSYLTIDKMRLFVQGEQAAIKYYHAPVSTIGGFLVGFAAGTGFMNNVPTFYCLPAPFIYTLAISIKSPRYRKQQEINAYLRYEDEFLSGYKTTAKSRKVKNGLFGGLLGFAAGLGTAFIISTASE
jgi:hypothetical protein